MEDFYVFIMIGNVSTASEMRSFPSLSSFFSHFHFISPILSLFSLSLPFSSSFHPPFIVSSIPFVVLMVVLSFYLFNSLYILFPSLLFLTTCLFFPMWKIWTVSFIVSDYFVIYGSDEKDFL